MKHKLKFEKDKYQSSIRIETVDRRYDKCYYNLCECTYFTYLDLKKSSLWRFHNEFGPCHTRKTYGIDLRIWRYCIEGKNLTEDEFNNRAINKECFNLVE